MSQLKLKGAQAPSGHKNELFPARYVVDTWWQFAALANNADPKTIFFNFIIIPLVYFMYLVSLLLLYFYWFN